MKLIRVFYNNQIMQPIVKKILEKIICSIKIVPKLPIADFLSVSQSYILLNQFSILIVEFFEQDRIMC